MHPESASHRLNRRALLRGSAAGAGALAAGLLLPRAAGAAPAFARPDRPLLTHGVQLGDPRPDGAVVWTRADRPSRMFVEISQDPGFADARRVPGPLLTPETDGTGEVLLRGLPPGRQFHYRVVAEDLDGRVGSEPLAGSFRTVPRQPRDVRFLWSGDVVGQGWGINPDIGGMTIYSAMAARNPDFFLHSGDTVYADGPLKESVTLPDGRVWRNVVTPEKSKVAETLAEYRGQFAYNLLDENVRRFAAHVPQLVQWDDHEVTNNWYPGEILDKPEYTEKRVDVLAQRAFQAFHEWQPVRRQDAVDGRVYRKVGHGPLLDVFVLDMRSYRDPNSEGTRAERILGERQARWLVDELSRSRATWKVIASDMPIGIIVPDGDKIEAVANGLPGAPNGREAELAWVLAETARRQVRNVVWLTADVHYSAAIRYSPERAAFDGFDPFWEFVSGPLHAGAFGPSELDPTFGPEQVFVSAPTRQGASPLEGFQHFGEVNIDSRSRRLTVDLRDAAGKSLWSTTLDPRR
ncbi:alkaline phosphatase D family protein [Saccharopolyspora erythraea]|uniref:alkaline phosphatase D family protein n=1 Tax=Saccharopolyspora erythraea TaxID=1836 RepID=UPI001BA6EC18|nr:alkaline phosphatase D family protein [Saccharopolyspora erythraea]QUH01001.1 alkaline phosphatase D family protein [Saccharopolyspora erythraea]